MTKQLPPVNVGVDVSKDKLDVHLLERDLSLSVANHDHAIASLINRLARYRLERIVVEATGRLEHAFFSAAIAKGLPVVVVAPLKVRRFAEAAGQLAKTDAIDARLIARFAAALKPAARPAAHANSQIIKDLVVRRRQLTSLRTTEKNRRGVMPEALKPSIDRIIESLDREITSLELLIQDERRFFSALWSRSATTPTSNASMSAYFKRAKHKKVALTACIRKIVTALNAMLRNNKPWQSSFA
jgi:transposase